MTGSGRRLFTAIPDSGRWYMTNLHTSEMLDWLNERDPLKLTGLFRAARACAVEHVGSKVYFRGLIESGNVCEKNCHYCGIRRGNRNFPRYSMTESEILACAREAFEMNYGSVVLQAGERCGPGYSAFIEKIIRGIKTLSGGKIGITLSLGEQSLETYEAWFRAGAHRYLLRIETSNPTLIKTFTHRTIRSRKDWNVSELSNRPGTRPERAS